MDGGGREAGAGGGCEAQPARHDKTESQDRRSRRIGMRNADPGRPFPVVFDRDAPEGPIRAARASMITTAEARAAANLGLSQRLLRLPSQL